MEQPDAASIWNEVFPVTLVLKQAVLIRVHPEQTLPALMLTNLPHCHPNDLVVQHLVTFFGDAFDPDQMIVHSTSWRYEQACDRLLLTYVAVLPQGCWVQQWLAAARIDAEPIGAIEKQYGTHLFPPEQLEWHHALAHALDHLASLSTYDPAIQAALEPEWRAILRPRCPQPAGCLQRSSSETTGNASMTRYKIAS